MRRVGRLRASADKTDWRAAAEARLMGQSVGQSVAEKGEEADAAAASPRDDSSSLGSIDGPTMEEIEHEFDALTRKLEDEARLLAGAKRERRRRDEDLVGVVARTQSRSSSNCFLTSVQDDTGSERESRPEHYPNYRREVALAATERVQNVRSKNHPKSTR